MYGATSGYRTEGDAGLSQVARATTMLRSDGSSPETPTSTRRHTSTVNTIPSTPPTRVATGQIGKKFAVRLAKPFTMYGTPPVAPSLKSWVVDWD